MTTIQVTQPQSEGSATLTLHTCSACGSHVWEREGERLDRGSLLGVVRERLAEGPAPRVPAPRAARPTRVVLPDAAPSAPKPSAEVEERLARFVPHGS